MNPYHGVTFFGFWKTLASRIVDFAQGNLTTQNLTTDETQLLVLMAVAASGAIVGSFLVLRKMTMFANSLSHTILIGIVLAFLWSYKSVDVEHSDLIGGLSISSLIIAALLMGVITMILTEFLNKKIGLQEDASIGLVFTSLFALGIVAATTIMRNAHIGIEAVMGNVDALHIDDIQFVYLILIANIVLTFLFFKEYALTTFDPALARALGFSTICFNYLLMVQVSATAIGAFRAVGVLMVLALITGPPLAARLLTYSLKKMIVLAVFLGCLSASIGVALSRHILSSYNLPLSTAGIVVCTIVGIFIISAIIHFVISRNRYYKHYEL